MRVRYRLVVALFPLLTLALLACGDGDEAELRVIVDGTVLPSPTPTPGVTTPTSTPAPLPFTPTPPPSQLDPEDLRGFVWPLGGACLPGLRSADAELAT